MDLHILPANFNGVVITAFDLFVDVEFCGNCWVSHHPLNRRAPRGWISSHVHTPLCILVILLSRALHDVVAQNVGNLDRMVDLHASIDGRTAVLLEGLAGFLASSKEDGEVVFK